MSVEDVIPKARSDALERAAKEMNRKELNPSTVPAPGIVKLGSVVESDLCWSEQLGVTVSELGYMTMSYDQNWTKRYFGT